MGVEKNEQEAVKWFRRSALQGNSLAQNSLGFCYEEGLGIEKDPKFAAYWYLKASRQGNPWAQVRKNKNKITTLILINQI